MEFNKLTNNQKIIVNTLAVSGIAMFSVIATQPFSWAIIYSGLIAGILTGLIQLRKISEKTTEFLMVI